MARCHGRNEDATNLLDDPAFSDARVVLLVAGSREGRQVAVSRGVLSCASPKFKAQFQRWATYGADGHLTPHRDSSRGQKRRCEVAPASTTSIELMLDAEDQVPAAMALLEFCYTRELPQHLLGPGSVQLLVQVHKLADRFQCAGCTDAAMRALSTMPPAELRLKDALWLLAEASAPPAVHEMCVRSLLSRFGDASNLMGASGQLDRDFSGLPAAAVAALLSHAEFKADSEDSVAAVAAAWIAGQRSRVRSHEVAQLSACIRAKALSAPFLGTVLPALKDPLIDRTSAAFLVTACAYPIPEGAGGVKQLLADGMPGAWLSAPEPRPGAVTSWSVPIPMSTSDVQKAIDEMQGGDGASFVFSQPKRFMYGMMVRRGRGFSARPPVSVA